MTAGQYLFIGLVLLGVLALLLWPLPADAEPEQADDTVSIDYRPSVLRALMQQGLTFADVATSPRRNAVFLTDTQQAALMPGASELAARRAMQGARVRLTGSRA